MLEVSREDIRSRSLKQVLFWCFRELCTCVWWLAHIFSIPSFGQQNPHVFLHSLLVLSRLWKHAVRSRWYFMQVTLVSSHESKGNAKLSGKSRKAALSVCRLLKPFKFLSYLSRFQFQYWGCSVLAIRDLQSLIALYVRQMKFLGNLSLKTWQHLYI